VAREQRSAAGNQQGDKYHDYQQHEHKNYADLAGLLSDGVTLIGLPQ